MGEEYDADIAVAAGTIADVLSRLTSTPVWETLIDSDFLKIPIRRYLRILLSREEGILLVKYGVQEREQYSPEWAKEVFALETQKGLSLRSLAVLQAADTHNKWLQECQEELAQLKPEECADDLDDLPY